MSSTAGSESPASILISMGSNIEPEKNLGSALELLVREVKVAAVSRVFASAAVGSGRAPDFLNAAIEIRTLLPAAELKYGVLREVEAQLGRQRTTDRNAPRSIDLDIAVYGDLVIESEPLGLKIPDPEILTRPHVALPLADLAPEHVHPLTGEMLKAIADRLRVSAAVRLSRHAGLLAELLA